MAMAQLTPTGGCSPTPTIKSLQSPPSKKHCLKRSPVLASHAGSFCPNNSASDQPVGLYLWILLDDVFTQTPPPSTSTTPRPRPRHLIKASPPGLSGMAPGALQAAPVVNQDLPVVNRERVGTFQRCQSVSASKSLRVIQGAQFFWAIAVGPCSFHARPRAPRCSQGVTMCFFSPAW